jgi:hypothetical protein
MMTLMQTEACQYHQAKIQDIIIPEGGLNN